MRASVTPATFRCAPPPTASASSGAGAVRGAGRVAPVKRTSTTNDGRSSPRRGQVRGRSASSGKSARKPAATRVPLFRPVIRRRQMHAVLECLVSEEVGPGPIAGQLIGEVAAALDCRGGLALADYGAAAAAALHLAIETAAGAEDPPAGGSRPVLMPALVSLPWVYAARAAGRQPLLVDVDPETGSLDRESLQRMLAHRPCALVTGHVLGGDEPLDEVRAAGVPIVEDVSAGLLGIAMQRADTASGKSSAARRAGTGGAAGGDADDAPPDQRPDQRPDHPASPASPAPRAPAGDVLVAGLQAPGILAAGGGGLVLARSPRGRRSLAGYGVRFGWAGLADVNAALALAQWHDLAGGRVRCAELAARFRDAVARSRHRTLAPAATPGPLFPVVVADGLRAAQRYATRHHVETRLACEGSAITGVLPAEDDAEPPASVVDVAAAADDSADDSSGGAATEERLPGAQELARRSLLFPLYPELRDTQAGQVARVLATLP